MPAGWTAALLALFFLLNASAGSCTTVRVVSADDVGLEEHLGAKIPLDSQFHDESGKPVRLAELVSGPTLILPVYYGCTNICYNLQWGVAQVLPKLTSRPGSDYRVISLSIDEHDTPALATSYKRAYLTSMHTPFPQDGWRFLTGDEATIRVVMQAAGYGFQRRGRDFLHPAASFVIGGDGTIIRYLYGSTIRPKDLSLALIEARDGTTGKTIRTVMDYCFTFDSSRKTYVFNLLRISATAIIICCASFMAFLYFGSKKRKPDTLEKR